MTSNKNQQPVARRWILLTLLVVAALLLGALAWPYLSFLADREALRTLIVDSGPWAPVVYMALQLTQVIIAPIPGSVISLAGGYVFETWWATIYTMIGTTLGFLVVFMIAKKFGRRAIRYFISEEKLNKYDEFSSKKGSFAFIAVGFLFPFIPDPVLGYIAGTTPIPTRILMVIAVVMRTPGVVLTSLVGSQVGQGNYAVVVLVVVLLAIVLLISVIYYKKLLEWTNNLYNYAMKEQTKELKKEEQQVVASQKRKRRRRRRRKAVTKKVTRTLSGRRRTKRRK